MEMAAEPEEEDEEEEESKEDAVARIEKETAIARSKELKAMAVQDLKELLQKSGLETEKVKKEDMIKSMLASEAKARAEAREHEAKVRGVMEQKRQELESTSVSDICKMCASMGIEGARTKEDRIARILTQFVKEGGVEKALAQKAQDQRREDLSSMETSALCQLCDRAGVDPYVAEVLAGRIIKLEAEAGRFAKPQLGQMESTPDAGSQRSLVDSILAKEAARKAEEQQQAQRANAAEAKKKELKAMTIEELKKLLTKRGKEAEGKKESMVETLFSVMLQEEAINARKAELKSMAQQDLKSLVSSKGIEAGGKKEDMVSALLAHEAKQREDLQAFESKLDEVLAQKKEELEGKTNADLKELCTSKGLAVGGGKEDKLARLLEHARVDKEADAVVSKLIRNQRMTELSAMDKAALVSLCEKVGADPCVREVMIERLLDHEAEYGVTEPAHKKARKSKK